MQKNIYSHKLIYRFEEEGFSISIYELTHLYSNYVEVKYEGDASIYLCNSLFESAVIMCSLLSEYWEKKRIVEELIWLI